MADQLRSKGKGTPDEARGNAHQHNSQLRTGLEQIADKHATRLPALFHLDAKTVEKEKAAGRPVPDAIPMNVYFYKDAQDGKYHLYDLTTPSRPHEQTIEGPPTAAMMNTFFEEVARYPAGEVRYTLPGGSSGVAATTGKTKWYEWVGYAGLAAAAVGLAFVTAGASVPATVCFAAGALAGGVSAAGHLGDTLHLGTATTATIVLDVTQIAASFASAGAMNITLKAGRTAAALASSRWFLPLVGSAASADVVQLVALTDITFIELSKIQSGAGTPEDKQRAMAVLLTQLIVATGMTALSVQGARSARALAGQSLEIVEQNGAKVLRVTGEETPVPSTLVKGSEDGAPAAAGRPKVTGEPSAVAGADEPKRAGEGSDASKAARDRSGKPEPSVAAGRPAKFDASMSNARASEQATAGRVAAKPEFAGRTFRSPPPPDPGFDWADDLGRTFDAMGDGTKSKYFNLEQFKASIDHHLLKGNTFTVIDMTGYSPDQIAAVRAYVDTLPAGAIIRVGF